MRRNPGAGEVLRWREQFPPATIVCQGDTFTFKLDQALTDNGVIFLVIEATEGQSNGVSRAHSKASAPKIFFRYYYVNSSTGEKSGTMLAECKWTAADAGGEP